jgi:hypothetical protein
MGLCAIFNRESPGALVDTIAMPSKQKAPPARCLTKLRRVEVFGISLEFKSLSIAFSPSWK